jgi:hypothetical protein
MKLQGQELWNHIESKVRQEHGFGEEWTLRMVDLRGNDIAYYRIMNINNSEITGGIFYGDSEPGLPEIEDSNQLTMAIDNDVVIVNPIQVGD